MSLGDKSVSTSSTVTKSEHNFMFTRITNLVKLMIDKNDELINNNEIKPYSVEIIDTQYIADQAKKHMRSDSDFNLKRIIFKCSWLMFLKGILYNLGNYLSGCLGIYFLDLITDDLKSPSFSLEQDKYTFIFKIMMVFVCFMIKTVMSQQSEWIMYLHDCKQQSLMQYLIFKKSLRTVQYCDSRDTNDQADISNLLTTDSKESIYVFYGIVEFVSGQITIIIILYFLYLKLRTAVFYGVIFLVFSVLFNVYIQSLINNYFDKEQSWSDKRISLTKDVVEGMKSIKYLGWENIFLKKINQLREGQFEFTKKARITSALTGILWICMSYVLLYVFLAAYSWQGNDILSQNIFTILALFGYLKYPLGNIPYSINYFLKSLVSLKRIQKFLNQNEISSQDYEIKQEDKSNKSVIQIQNTVFSWPRLNPEKEENILNTKKSDKTQKQQELSTYNQLISQDSENFIDESTAAKEFILQIMNLQIQKGTLNFIIGEIGSGKTALLLGLLNEISNKEIVQGESSYQKRIKINGSIGYVSGNHWLQSRTIKENILFGEKYDNSWYQTCIQACKLDEDFTSFEKGDLKIIGPGGSNLSGGQRQRIALCRALYQKKNIYLFDDIFSSLDIHVAKEIFQTVIQKILIGELNSTVLFVTSHYTFLKQHLTSNIILVSDGKVSTDKDDISLYLTHISHSHFDNHLTASQSSNKHSQQNIEQKLNDGKYEDKTQLDQDEDEYIGEVEQSNKQIEEEQIQQEDEGEDEQNQEFREKGGIKKDTLSIFFKSRGFFVTILHIIFSLITQASQMIIDFWLRDYSEGKQDSDIVKGLNQILSGFDQIFQVLTLINLIIAFLTGFFYVISALRCGQYIFHKLTNSIMYSKMTFFDQNPVGRIVSRVSSDQNEIDDVLQWHFHVLLEKLAYLIGYPLGMIIQMPYISIHFAIIMFLAYLLSLKYRDANRQLKRLNQVNSSQVLTVLNENSKGITLIRGMNKNSYMMNDFISEIDKFVSAQIVQNALSIWFVMRLFILSNSSALFVVLWNIYYVLTCEGEININSIALGLIYSMLFSTVFGDVMAFYTYFEADILSIERVSQYFSNQKENLEQVADDDLENTFMGQSSLADYEDAQNEDKYSIIFSNVYLKYQQNSNENQASSAFENTNFALKNVNLKIKKGEKIAFCGRTGSGKTSILNALFRLYDIQQGSIRVNSTDIAKLSLSNLRKQMSIIPQYGFLFNASLKDNLDPNSTLTNSQINNVLDGFQTLQIKKQDNGRDKDSITIDSNQTVSEEQEIKQNGNGILNMEIQESGKNLSNGEKQIINFFRIVFRDSNIICLDEATSNMDPKTDKELQKELFKFSEDKTLIVITHRLENIEMYDRIFVMDQGEIVEQGNISQLKVIPNGFFNRLIQSQSS